MVARSSLSCHVCCPLRPRDLEASTDYVPHLAFCNVGLVTSASMRHTTAGHLTYRAARSNITDVTDVTGPTTPTLHVGRTQPGSTHISLVRIILTVVYDASRRFHSFARTDS